MARRLPTCVVLLPVLAACSTAPNVPVDTLDDDALVYLEGRSTRYAVCVDELPSEDRPRHTGLHGAVVAGDASMTAAASLFRCSGVYTLDLVLHNHGDRGLAIDRSEIKLYDANGVPLIPLIDWPAGVDHGLRAEQSTEYTDDAVQLGSRPTRGDAAGVPGKGRTPTGSVPLQTTMANDEVLFERDLRTVRRTVVLPAVVTVSPQHHVPYWAYWRADDDVEFPLIATIRVGDKRMVMEFGLPEAAFAR